MINNRAIAFLTDINEVFASASFILIIFGSIGLLVSTFILIKLHKNFVKLPFQSQRKLTISYVASIIIIIILCFLGMRGGVQQIPINESAAYFSEHRVLNNIATNPIWHLGSSLKRSSIHDTNPYLFMSNEKAAFELNKILPNQMPGNNLENILSVKNPNIILILLESWTADVIEPLGGDKLVTPEFTKLTNSGLLFTQMYSSGFRTDQALTSILSGFPSQPNKSIIRFTSKIQKLPSLSKTLVKNGYQTSFYYGGELGFANMKAYLLSQGIETIVSKDNFKSEDMNSKWGAHDGIVFDKLDRDLDKMHPPFFNTILTLSTHEPFEVPMSTPFNGSEESDKFRKSAYYTDHCLGEFMNSITTKSWYENTIVLIVADHGHILPRMRDFYDPEARKIPFLITGGALKDEYKGQRIDLLANQHDIPGTLLNQLDISSTEFKWSNDIFQVGRKNFAYLSQDNAITFITDQGIVTKNIQFPKVKSEDKSDNNESNNELNTTAKAYIQLLFEDFLSY